MHTIDASTLRLAAVIESSDDAIISQTLDGTIETWNHSAERLFGYSAADAIGRSIDLIVPPQRRQQDEAAVASLRDGGAAAHFETIALTSGGQMVPISLAISAIRTPEGAIVGISRIARDISGQKALEREAFRLAAIVNSSADAIVSKNLDGIVQTWNKAAERMFGYAAEEIIGRSIMTIIPADRKAEEDDVLSRIRAGKSIEHFETVRRRKDGTLIDISLSVSPIRDTTGLVIGASKIARDISRQKLLERETFRLAAIVDSSDDAIASKDLNGIVQTWNRAAERMFGYTAEEIIGRSITTIIPAERRAEETRVLAEIRAGRSIEHFETVRQRKDGSLIPISLTVSPVRGRDGTVIGASKIIRDNTIQHELMRASEEANRVKDQFLAMLSHELRTPLNAVLGYTRMLRIGHFDDDRREQAIDIIERNANVLAQLVSDVLDVSSIVTGKIRVNPTVCNLADVVRAAIDVVAPSVEAKGIALRLDASDALLPVRCDADRIQQVFWNLLSNAVKFTPRGGRIDICAGLSGDDATVVVSDTGIGIRREALPYVFQQFWQGETSHNRQVGGLGLGLALARHFVELHGGTIAADSAGEGKGATFTVCLPLAKGS
jgi:PAS domain S-box-containing protein